MDTDAKEAALWHAFNTLDDQRSDRVPKSKLKVLAHNLGTIYGIEGLEQKIEELLEENDLSFKEFSDFIKQHIFACIKQDESILQTRDISPLPPRKRSMSNSAINPGNFNDICWMLCGKLYSPRDPLNAETSLVPDGDQNHSMTLRTTKCLWEIFCFLAERDCEHHLVTPTCLDVEEVDFVCRKYLDITGQIVHDIEQSTAGDKSFVDFSSFLVTFMANCLNGMSPMEVEIGAIDLHEMFIQDCLKKGVLLKRGNAKAYAGWKERYFILTPKRLSYYTTTAKRELKGEIHIVATHTAEGLPDKPGAKSNRLTYSTNNRVYDMSAPDLKTKNEWISVMRTAIAHCDMTISYQREACNRRRQQRHDTRRRKREEEQARLEENERIQQRIAEIEAEKEARGAAMLKMKEEAEVRDAEQCRLQDQANQKKEELQRERLSREAAELRLQEEAENRLKELQSKMSSDIELEKQAREEAETKLYMEEALRLAEEERLRDLQEMNERLQALLQEEQEARKDEEIVRCLQARLLEEEFQKNEDMEKLQKEISEKFEAEKQRSEGLEHEKSKKEEELSLAMEQHMLLEKERMEAEARIEEATKKLQDAEQKRIELESRIKKRTAPIGLARPLQVEARPLVTHRGEGAFPKLLD